MIRSFFSIIITEVSSVPVTNHDTFICHTSKSLCFQFEYHYDSIRQLLCTLNKCNVMLILN
jgi:hypothetical protein